MALSRARRGRYGGGVGADGEEETGVYQRRACAETVQSGGGGGEQGNAWQCSERSPAITRPMHAVAETTAPAATRLAIPTRRRSRGVACVLRSVTLDQQPRRARRPREDAFSHSRLLCPADPMSVAIGSARASPFVPGRAAHGVMAYTRLGARAVNALRPSLGLRLGRHCQRHGDDQ